MVCLVSLNFKDPTPMEHSKFSLFNKSSTFLSGVFAVGIYLFLIVMLLLYFNIKEKQQPTHYVKKNEDSIRVTMASFEKKPQTKKPEPKRQSTPKKPTKTTKPKPQKERVKKEKDRRKKVIKEKVVQKPKPKPKPKPKRPKKKPPPPKVNKPKDLFANVSAKKKPEKNIIKVSDAPIKPKRDNIIKVTEKKSASELISSTLKKDKKSDKGIENAYLALIEEKLKGWPAQSEYAGERAKVWIKVEPSGRFVFKVTSASSIDSFNSGLIAYLKQLQRFGFGPHKGKRAYTLNVEFVAKE